MEYFIVHQSMIPTGLMSECLIVMRRDLLSGKTERAAKMQWIEVNPYSGFPTEDSFIVANGGFGHGSVTSEIREFMQAMTDAAWKLGIRPAQAESSELELKAVRGHLEDMRTLALPKKEK